MKNLYLNRRCRQTGTYLILIPVIFLTIVSGLAISVFVGNTLADIQRVQTAAEAGAIAGAFAVRRERTALESADTKIKNEALARVHQAARQAAEDNGFEHGKDNIQVNPTWPPIYTSEAGAYYAENSEYIRVTVQKPIDYLFFDGVLGLLPTRSISTAAVGRVGTDTLFNTCPGLYMYGDPTKAPQGKILDLKSATFFIDDGGIYIDYLDDTGNSMFGSSSTMTAQWIEINIDGGETASVDYYCTLPELHECTPKNVDKKREVPEFDELPPNACSSPNYPDIPADTVMTECINGGYNFGVCTAEACKNSKTCTGLACLKSNGCKTNCLDGVVKVGKKDVKVCPDLSSSPNKNYNDTGLEADNYCQGLTFVNTGTSSDPLLLKPESTTPNNYFNLNGSDMMLINSYLDASAEGISNAEGEPYEGITILSSIEDGVKSGLLTLGESNRALSKSELSGDVRIYFNAIQVYDSTLSINTFTEKGCGLLPGVTTTVVQ